MELRKAYAQSQARVKELETQLHQRDHGDIYNTLWRNNDSMWSKVRDLESRLDNLDRGNDDVDVSHDEHHVTVRA